MSDNESTPFNNDPKIMLVDSDNELIAMVSQRQAYRLISVGFCKLILDTTPTIQFIPPRNKWHYNYLSQKRYKHLPRKKALRMELYGNYHIQSPSGETMFHCDVKKALWYLNRGLVDIIAQEPPTLRFRFSPDGPGHVGDDYYLTPKVNRCVVCGKTKELNRHHVLPRVFRKHCADGVKSHNYHDVLLMCIPCHDKYEIEANKLKQAICKEFGFDISDNCAPIYDAKIGHAVSDASALLHHGDKIPEPRKEFLKNKLREYLGKEEITTEDLMAVTSQYCWKVPEGFKHYGEYVAERIGDIQKFVERWRSHFLEVMQPQYMPEHWDIEKPAVRNVKGNEC